MQMLLRPLDFAPHGVPLRLSSTALGLACSFILRLLASGMLEAAKLQDVSTLDPTKLAIKSLCRLISAALDT